MDKIYLGAKSSAKAFAPPTCTLVPSAAPRSPYRYMHSVLLDRRPKVPSERWASIARLLVVKLGGVGVNFVWSATAPLHSDSPGTMLQAALHRSCCRVLLRSVAPLVTTGVRTFPQTQTIAGSTERCSVASLP